MELYSTVAGLAGLAFASLSTLDALFRGEKRISNTRRKKKARREECGLEIISSSTPADIDICFVHGTTGDRRSTWTSNNGNHVFWPQELLQKDPSLPPARILLYGYDTDVNSLCWLTRRTLYHHARHFLDELAKARDGCESRPLLFVAHGLGGILVKSALIFAYDARFPSGSPVEHIFLSTFGVLSFGTPHTHPGSKPLDEIIDRLCQLPDDLNPKPRTGDFEDFASGDWKDDVKLLGSRLDRYKAIATQIPEIFCYESEDVPNFGLIGPQAVLPKAQHYIHKSCQTIRISNDHINMAKFTTSTPTFSDICDAIVRLYDGSKTALSRRRSMLSGPEGESRDKIGMNFGIAPILPKRDESFKLLPLLVELEHELELKRDEPLVIPGWKSNVALEFAHRKLEVGQFSCAFWIKADNLLSLKSSFEQIGHKLWEAADSPSSPERADLEALLGIKGARQQITSKAENHETVVRFVLDWLAFKNNNNWLLIFDQVEDIDCLYIKDYVPLISHSHGCVIMTTRRDSSSWKSLQLPVFNDGPAFLGSSPKDEQPLHDDGASLLPSFSIQSLHSDDEIPISPKLTKGRSDIDVAYTGSFVLSTGHFSEGDPESQITSMLDLKPPLNVFERDLINSCLMLNALPIPTVLAQFVLKAPPNTVSGIESQLKALNTTGWIRYDSDLRAFEIPEAVRKDLKMELNDKEKRHYAQQACTLVSRTVSELSEDNMFEFERRIAENQLLPHANACFNLCQEFGASIICDWKVLADLCERCNKFADAARFYRLVLDQHSFGPDSPSQRSRGAQSAKLDGVDRDLFPDTSTLVSVESFDSRLNDAHSEPADMDDAEQESQNLYRLQCQVGLIRTGIQRGKQNELAGRLLPSDNTGIDASGDGDQDSLPGGSFPIDIEIEIGDVLEAHIDTRDRVQEPNCTDWTDVLEAHIDTRDRVQEPNCTDWTDLLEARMDAGDISRRSSVDACASISSSEGVAINPQNEQWRPRENERVNSGKLDPSGELEKECKKILRRVQERNGREYRELRYEVLRQLILIEREARKWKSAIKHNQKLIAILEIDVGPSDKQTIFAIRQLAHIHMHQGVYSEAELLLARVLMTYEQELGVSDIRTILALQLLARCSRYQGDLRRARDLYLRVVNIVAQRLGIDHIETAKAKTDLAEVYDAMKNFEDSGRLFNEALAAARQLGEENSEYRRIDKIYQTRKRGRMGEDDGLCDSLETSETIA